MKLLLGQNYMITIDCKDVEPILNELAIYVSDQIAAIPAIKLHKFVLAPIEDDEPINHAEVVTSIKEFLESIGERRNFGVISNNNNITISQFLGKKLSGLQNQLVRCFHVRIAVMLLNTRLSITTMLKFIIYSQNCYVSKK